MAGPSAIGSENGIPISKKSTLFSANISNNFSEILQVPINWKGINILNHNFIKRAMTRKIIVHAWTINDENNMRKLIRMGINGIITDEPDLLLKVMRDENLSF